MSEPNHEKEELILQSVKKVLTDVIKDTATPPGMRHPLKDDTIRAMRDCLVLISDREQELAQAAGRNMDMRPHFTDEPRKRGDVVIPLETSGLFKKRSEQTDK